MGHANQAGAKGSTTQTASSVDLRSTCSKRPKRKRTGSQQEHEDHNKWARHRLQKKNLNAAVIQKVMCFGSMRNTPPPLHALAPVQCCILCYNGRFHRSSSFTKLSTTSAESIVKKPRRRAVTKQVKSLSKAQKISTFSGWPVCKTPLMSVLTYNYVPSHGRAHVYDTRVCVCVVRCMHPCSLLIYIYICVCVCVYVCIYIYVCVCVHIYIYVCVCVCGYICIYVCVCTYVYIYTYIFINTHTHTNIYIYMYIYLYS